ncbi:MAG: hypothetical protein IT290_12560 [Deltaproteobacteria bacterium]|nr:hypothetical protein [Deltaproteobacteria bacterium]
MLFAVVVAVFSFKMIAAHRGRPDNTQVATFPATRETVGSMDDQTVPSLDSRTSDSQTTDSQTPSGWVTQNTLSEVAAAAMRTSDGPGEIPPLEVSVPSDPPAPSDTALTSRLALLERELAAANARIAEYNVAANEPLTQEMESLRQKLDAAEQRVRRLQETTPKPAPDAASGEIAAQQAAKVKQLEGERVELALTLKKNLTELDLLRKERDRLQRSFDRLQEKSEESKQTITESSTRVERQLRESLEKERAEHGKTKASLESRVKENQELKKFADEVKRLDQELSKLSDEAKRERTARETNEKQTADQRSGLQARDATIIQMRKELEAKSSELDELRGQVASLTDEKNVLAARRLELEREMVDMKNNVLLSNAQAEAMSGHGRNAARQQFDREAGAATQRRSAPVENQRATESYQRQDSASIPDVPIVEVSVDKAFLRAGPGEEHSPTMEVQGGTRLTVEARQGDWYRVISPTGTREFIRGDVVQIPGLPRRQSRPSRPAPKAPARQDSANEDFPIPQSRPQQARPAQRSAPAEMDFPIPQTRENVRDDESITDLPSRGAQPLTNEQPSSQGLEQFDEDEEKALRKLREALIKK